MQRRREPGFAVVFQAAASRVARVSLNRCEQRLFDYLHTHKDERQFWQGKLQSALKGMEDEHVVAARLETELWRYYVERCEMVPALREAARSEGMGRTSMRNLAELMLRIWTEPRPKKKAPAGSPGKIEKKS